MIAIDPETRALLDQFGFDEARLAAAAAALAALVATDPRVRPFLADRAAREPVPAIRQTLSRALEA